MTREGWITIGVLGVVVGLLTLTSIGPDLIMLAGLTALLVLGVVQPEQAMAGFANEGVVTIGILFVVAAGLRETGAIDSLAHRILGRPKTPWRAQARLVLPIMAISPFLYNTPCVAIMMPVVHDWAKKIRVSVSHVMIPLSYITILGGLLTLIGSSTNLVINGLVITEAHRPSLHLLEQAWIGVPCAVVGIAYILIFSRWLLPERQPVLREESDPRQYTIEMLVEPKSVLAGQTIEQAGLRHLTGLYLLEIIRGDEVIAAVGSHQRLHESDRLIFVGVVDSVVELHRMRGLRPATDQVFKLDAPRSHRSLIEAVVSNSCPLVGQTIREGRFRTRYNAAVIAVGRNGERLRQKIGDIILRPGDTLLLEARPAFLDQQRNSRDFYLVSQIQGAKPVDHSRGPIALAIVLGMVVLAVSGLTSMLAASLIAAGLMVATRCCSGAVARQSVNWPVLLVIGAAFGIGQALKTSGLAGLAAHGMISLGGSSPLLTLAMVYGVTMVFTELMSHSAAAVLVFPIALAAAHSLNVSFMPFIMAILVAASCTFATPIGYPTNLMVYGPGGYRFTDFLRFGGPLNLLIWAVTILLTPILWPF
ncbi:MAG TPA: SLC13 family permease [Gemmataceae bacterium]|nr:SLC13 family permease [Gemmataceae bacterium]